MVFSIKVMPPGALVPTVPSTPVDEEHRHARPDFHFAVEATDDSTFADLRTRALQYIADDQADYLRKHPAASFGELKLERGTTLRSRQRVATIFPHHTSPEEIVLLLYHTNEPPPQAQKRKAPEPPLPTPDTSKRRKGKERATEPPAGPAAINAIQRIMSSQSAQRSPAAVANDPKQAPHWSLDEDRAFLPYILEGKSVRDALELAGLDRTRSKAAGRNRRKFYVDKTVTLDNLEEVRVQSARGRRFATFEAIPDSTQFPPKSSESASSKKKRTDLSKPKSGGPTSMPPPARHAWPRTNSHPRTTALPTGTTADSTQSTDDALLDLLDDLSDNEPTVVHHRMEVSESEESPQATQDRNDRAGTGAEAEADRVVETQREHAANDAAHHDGDGDEDDVIEFEDMTGSVDEEVPRSASELRGERLVEVWPGEDEYPSDSDGTDDEDVATTYVRVSEAAYQRMPEVGEANRRAVSNRHDAQHGAPAADQLDSMQVQPDVDDPTGPGRPDLPLPTTEPEESADDQPQQITRPPRRHASHLTDEALKAECRQKCVYHEREGPWYLPFLVYQRDLQYARDDGDEDRARTLISDFDHLDMKYRRKFFKIGPELFDNYDDWAPTPLVVRPGDDLPQLCYSQRELRIQKEAFDRREEELRRLKKAAEHLNEIELQDDARRRAMGGSESVGGDGESEDEQYYTVPTSAQKPREELRDYNPQVLLPPMLLKAKLSKLERKTLNRAAKRAAKNSECSGPEAVRLRT